MRGDAVLVALFLLSGCLSGAGELAGDLVRIRVEADDGTPLAGVAVEARCPGGGAWSAETDDRGLAVVDGVPPCSLAVVAPSEAGALVRADRVEGAVASRLEMDSLAGDLPSSRSAWSWLETVEPAAIVDRIEGAGLYAGEPGRFSLRGASWTQNAVLLDGVDVTDPLQGGTPMFLPDVDTLQSFRASSALAPAEYSAPGVSLALGSREPAGAWQGTAQACGLASGLQSAEADSGVPSIARFGSLLDASALLNGPLAGERLRLLVAGRLAHARRLERDDPAELESRLIGGSLQLAYRAGARDSFGLLVSLQSARRPLAARARFAAPLVEEDADARGAVLHWDHEGGRGTASVFAGLWSHTVAPRTEGRLADGTIERLRDGPVPDLAFPARSRRSSWSLGGRFALHASTLAGLWHAPRFGLALERAWSDERPGQDGVIPETVDGLAARAWDYAWAGPDSSRHALELAAWASERVVWRDRLFVEAGLRFESANGEARGAAQGVSWTALLPRVSARLRLIDAGRLSLLGGWGEYRHRLLLDQLAFGDPNAAQASVYRWTDTNADGLYERAERGPLVARVGPGAGGGSLAAIDPDLRPPRTRELVAGIEASGEGWVLRLTGFDRRETDLLESVDVGAPVSAYSVRYLPDPGGDIVGAEDDQLLPVFDRRPESFGLDRYVLMNATDGTGRYQGLELRFEKTLGGRLLLLAGATAGRTEIRGGNRGFRARENDQGVIGERLDDPNADTYSLGRGFFDRAYTVKIGGAWRGPRDFRLGLAARYQDGQPFGRLVVVPDLAQGPEAIPATPRGQAFGRAGGADPEGRPLTAEGHRFTYTLTLDARIQKDFRLGARRLALSADVFNLLGLRNEVEEDPVWGPSFREATALQPPRAVRFGARLDF